MTSCKLRQVAWSLLRASQASELGGGLEEGLYSLATKACGVPHVRQRMRSARAAKSKSLTFLTNHAINMRPGLASVYSHRLLAFPLTLPLAPMSGK